MLLLFAYVTIPVLLWLLHSYYCWQILLLFYLTEQQLGLLAMFESNCFIVLQKSELLCCISGADAITYNIL